jgi:hypothetical protein
MYGTWSSHTYMDRNVDMGISICTFYNYNYMYTIYGAIYGYYMDNIWGNTWVLYG